ncbi:DUF1700 domain-containing protein [Companilactobacillus sp. HBUAS56275]|uniref:DUF1700 domain-containing protein n=1 Tax=Candidatus Companilactobacillus pullicola TaxID=2838523 RepID=A0A9D1ZMY0_9LACO|nr:DUF1700 domain-containing protein [Candidatus Companilactobacillus pullicola]
MNKEEFLVELKIQLKKYGITNSDQYISYYSEFLEDLIEDGYSEKEAIKKIGEPNKIILSILSDEDVQIPRAKSKIKSALLLMGIPIWGPIIAAGYIILLALVFAVMICSIAFSFSGIWLLLGSLIVLFKTGILNFLFQLGTALIFGGMGIIFWQLFLFSFQKAYGLVKIMFHNFTESEV